jgi:hypothetical protein
MDRVLANHVVSGFQAIFEACNALAKDLPPERRAELEQKLQRVQQAKSAIMAEMM